MSQTRGRFIVIDGTDGSGKATQTELLVERLVKESLPVKTISFPQYGKKSAGAVEEYLEGKYGSASDVNAYQASVLFAVDRFDAGKEIERWLEEGHHVISDRYVTANMAHQGSKIADEEERRKFFDWAMEFEHNVMGIPLPDLNIVLHVPAQITLSLMEGRALKSGLTKDVHEADPDHLHAAERTYLDMNERFSTLTLITCVENDTLLSREDIHARIWDAAAPLFT